MPKTGLIASALLAATLSAALPATALAQNAATAQPAHYSVKDTLVGKLLDDPAAAAILEKLIPSVYANEMFKTAGSRPDPGGHPAVRAGGAQQRQPGQDPGRVRQDSGQEVSQVQ